MKRRCVIHFGMNKTGSSSIQESLFRYAPHLRDWHYLHVGHLYGAKQGPAIATAFGDSPAEYHTNRKLGLTEQEIKGRAEEIRAEYARQIQSSSKRNILLSAEYLSRASNTELMRLIDFLSPLVDEIEAVGYIRAPCSLAASTFQERVKGDALDILEPLALIRRYRDDFARFDRLIGKERVQFWKYDPAAFPNGCVVRDFCNRLNIDLPNAAIVRVNEGLSRDAVSLLYAYRQHGPGYGVGPAAIEENDRLIKRLTQLPGPKLRLATSSLEPALRTFHKQIAWMEERLGAPLEEPWIEEGPGVIHAQADLLCFSPASLQWLMTELALEAMETASPTPHQVAEWMHALRSKLAKEQEAPVSQPIGAMFQQPLLGEGGLAEVHTGPQAHAQQCRFAHADRDDQGAFSTERPFILGRDFKNANLKQLATPELSEAIGDNTGNQAFHYAIDRHFGADLEIIGWEADLKKINAQKGQAILPCANQLGPHIDLGHLVDHFSGIARPLVAVGLGAQSPSIDIIPHIPDGTIRWVKEIIAHAPSSHPNIGVRGAFSKQVLEHYGLGQYAEVIGCPSLWINPDPELGRKIQDRFGSIRRVAVTAGIPQVMNALERSLVELVTKTDGGYIVQSPFEMLSLVRDDVSLLPKTLISRVKNCAWSGMADAEFLRWIKRHARFFLNISEWMAYLREFDFVIGTRIHGVVLALQAEVPALCIVHDSRTHELCETLNIPFVRADRFSKGISLHELAELFVFDYKKFDDNRKALGESYVRFLENNYLKPQDLFLRPVDNNPSQPDPGGRLITNNDSRPEAMLSNVALNPPTLKKPILYIHIGPGKTGSSAIQKTLQDNLDYLKKQGVFYLGSCFENLEKRVYPWNRSGGNVDLGALPRAQRDAEIFDCLMRAFHEAANTYRCLIWSNERLFKGLQGIASVIRQAGERFQLHLIVYLRRQDRWLVSAYKQWGVKHKGYEGPVLSFSDWYHKKLNKQRLDYFAVLNEWRQALPDAQLTARVYEKHPDVCMDFIQIIGLDYEKLPYKVHRFYETPNDLILSYFALYNNLFHRKVLPVELEPLLSRCDLHKARSNSKIDFGQFDRGFLTELLAHYRESNEQLAQAFSTPDYEVRFDDEPLITTNLQLADPHSLIAGLLLMLKHLDAEVRELRAEVDQIQRAARPSILEDKTPAIQGLAPSPRQEASHTPPLRLAIGIRADYRLSATPALKEIAVKERGIDVYWIIDESRQDLNLPYFPKLFHRRPDLPPSPPGLSWYWYYGDYSFQNLQRQAPGYDYYILLSQATWIRPGFVQRLADELQDGELDFVGCGFAPRPHDWYWWENARTCFSSVYGTLFPLVVLSNRAIGYLAATRLDQIQTLGPAVPGIFYESFVPSALVQAGFQCLDLNELIPDAWSPETFSADKPIWVGEATQLARDQWVMHPLLAGEDYMRGALDWLRRNQLDIDTTQPLACSLFGNPLNPVPTEDLLHDTLTQS